MKEEKRCFFHTSNNIREMEVMGSGVVSRCFCLWLSSELLIFFCSHSWKNKLRISYVHMTTPWLWLNITYCELDRLSKHFSIICIHLFSFHSMILNERNVLCNRHYFLEAHASLLIGFISFLLLCCVMEYFTHENCKHFGYFFIRWDFF